MLSGLNTFLKQLLCAGTVDLLLGMFPALRCSHCFGQGTLFDPGMTVMTLASVCLALANRVPFLVLIHT